MLSISNRWRAVFHRDLIFCLKLSYYFIITVQWRWNLKFRDIIIDTFIVNFDRMYDEQEQLPVSKLIFATSPCQQTIDEIFHNSVYLK